MAAAKVRKNREIPSHVMWPRMVLLLSVLALTLIGLVMIYSASSVTAITEADELSQAQSASYLFDQIKFALVGIVFAILLWKVFPSTLWSGPWLWVVWGAAIGLLILTAVMGEVGLGAQRWLKLGPIGLQPAEFAKIAFILMAARILIDFRNHTLTVRGMLIQVGVLLLLPVLFLYRTQSDLGTTLIILVGVLAVMWIGEVPLKIILLVLGVGIVFAVVSTVFTGYRSDRLLFLNPWNDGMNGYDKGYQLIHSFYALSEGGLFGVGLGNSREKFLYLPEAETDFIFAIIGEEWGLVGALVVIALFLAILWAGMHIANSASNDFDRMVAGSCTIMMVFQAFLNIGCVIGLLPTTGKPLPFISSGGSSLIATFIMVGLVLSVSQQAGLAPSVYERRRDDLRVVRAAPEQPRSNTRKSSLDLGGPARRSSQKSGMDSVGSLGWDAVSSRSAKAPKGSNRKASINKSGSSGRARKQSRR